MILRGGSVFVDTGGWIAVAVGTDDHHTIAAFCYRDLLARNMPLITSDYVLDETITRVRYDVGHRQAVEFLELIEEAEKLGFLRIMHVDEDVLEAARDLFKRYSDQVFSFTDCTSFVLCQNERIQTAFAFDHHFSIFGLTVIPAD